MVKAAQSTNPAILVNSYYQWEGPEWRPIPGRRQPPSTSQSELRASTRRTSPK